MKKNYTIPPSTHLYFEVIGIFENKPEVLFGSFDKDDCIYEKESESASWKSEGFKGIKIKSRTVDYSPDPEVYGKQFIKNLGVSK